MILSKKWNERIELVVLLSLKYLFATKNKQLKINNLIAFLSGYGIIIQISVAECREINFVKEF